MICSHHCYDVFIRSRTSFVSGVEDDDLESCFFLWNILLKHWMKLGRNLGMKAINTSPNFSAALQLLLFLKKKKSISSISLLIILLLFPPCIVWESAATPAQHRGYSSLWFDSSLQVVSNCQRRRQYIFCHTTFFILLTEMSFHDMSWVAFPSSQEEKNKPTGSRSTITRRSRFRLS